MKKIKHLYGFHPNRYIFFGKHLLFCQVYELEYDVTLRQNPAVLKIQ